MRNFLLCRFLVFEALNWTRAWPPVPSGCGSPAWRCDCFSGVSPHDVRRVHGQAMATDASSRSFTSEKEYRRQDHGA
eukprot:4798421-Pyramimonas_sp.AAC.1